MDYLHPHNAAEPRYGGQDLEALAELPNYHGWILDTFAPFLTGRILEVGAGTGNFSSTYVNTVDEAVLVEPAGNLFPALAGRFAKTPHVRPLHGYLHNLYYSLEQTGLEDGSFDAAILVNVLEHIEDDLGTLRLLERLLRPDGRLLLFVPAGQWLYGSLDAQVDHVRRYSRSGLARAVGRAGFDVVQLRYFDVLGVAPWLVSGRLLRLQGFNGGMARIYDSLIVPLASRLERWFAPPLGKNLICVARRRAAGLQADETSLAA